MHSLSQFLLQVGWFSILIGLQDGYLLFAANLDDFHSIAKQLIPENIADSFARMASKQIAREREDNYDYEDSEEYEKSYEYKHDAMPLLKGRHESHKTNPKFVFSQSTQVDFDELVERVKKRLAIELKQKYQNNIRPDDSKVQIIKGDKAKNNKQSKNRKKSYRDQNDKVKQTNTQKSTRKLKTTTETEAEVNITMEEMSPFQDEPDYKESLFNKPKPTQVQILEEKDKRYEYADATKEEESLPNEKLNKATTNNDVYETHSSLSSEDKRVEKVETAAGNINDVYKKIDMTQKDSYEDYATPAREENIYASREVTIQKYISNNKRYKIQNYPSQQKRFDSRMTTNPNTVRPKTTRPYGNYKKAEIPKVQSDTEAKLVNSREIKAKTESLWYDGPDKVETDTIILTETSNKPKFGTRLPTRQTYKIVTPDYYGKLPIVAEKYDFDEPIPEQDREREIIKYIGNPPASVNKKVRLLYLWLNSFSLPNVFQINTYKIEYTLLHTT